MNFESKNLISRLVIMVSALLALSCTSAEEHDDGAADEPGAVEHSPMTAERLGELIVSVDENARLDGSNWYFKVADLDAIMIFDVAADRMRIVIPIGPSEDLPPDELMRLMQANFDSALDARYAIARGLLWGTYIHPLSTLTDEEFLLGLGQTANVVLSFGTSYSSGMFLFNDGDSAEIERKKLIDELKKKHRT